MGLGVLRKKNIIRHLGQYLPVHRVVLSIVTGCSERPFMTLLVIDRLLVIVTNLWLGSPSLKNGG